MYFGEFKHILKYNYVEQGGGVVFPFLQPKCISYFHC